MPTSYPGGLDNFTNPTASDTLDSATVPHAAQHANLNDAVEAIEAELGVNAKGSFASVAARISSSESEVVSLDQYAAEGSVLQNIPSRVHPAEQLLKQAVFWIDAAHSSASGQTVTNLGWGGSALNAQAGSSGSADSNDPKYLDWSGENYVYLPGGTNSITVPDSDALDITGDIDIRVHVAMDDWTPASFQYLMTKWDFNTQRSYALRLETDGTVRLMWTTDGTNTTLQQPVSSVATGVPDGAAKWIRATLDVNNGSGGYTVIFYTSDNGVTWTQLGSTITTITGTTSIFAGTELVSSATSVGKLYRLQILNGINGTPVLDIDTSVIPSGNASSFSAYTGQTVSINRATSGRKTTVVTHPVWLFGSDDLFTISDNDLIDFGATDSFTVLGIARIWNTPASNQRLILKGSASTQRWGLQVNGTSLGYNAVNNDGTNGAVAATPTFTQGTLHCIAGVTDRTAQTLTSYANATAGTAASTSTVGSLANSNQLRIGWGDAPSTGNAADMEFVAAAVFRRALTAAEIATLTRYYQGRIG